MYTNDDFNSVKKQIRSVLIKVAIIFAVFLTISLIVAKNVSNPLGLFILIIGICIDGFIWGIYGKPVVIYKNFVREILTGRKQKRNGYVVRIGSEPTYKDNRLFYYEVFVKDDEDEEMEQMLLLDSNKEFPNMQENSWYEFELYQNYIIDVEKMTA